MSSRSRHKRTFLSNSQYNQIPGREYRNKEAEKMGWKAVGRIIATENGVSMGELRP